MSEETQDFPKWVVPHESHVVRKNEGGAPEHVVTPEWPECHVNRIDGVVTVLVKNQNEEDRALTDVTPKPEPVAEVVAAEPVPAAVISGLEPVADPVVEDAPETASE